MPNFPDFSVLIPARLDSTRLPKKALRDILGVPMIVRVARRAAQSHAKKVWVATDSEEIIAACHQEKISTILTSTTPRSGTERLAEAAKKLSLASEEIIVNVQGDEPLIEPDLIDTAAREVAKTQAAMATLAHPIACPADKDNPNVVKVVLNHRGEALYFSRSPIPYQRDEHAPAPLLLKHIGIYAYRVAFLQRYAELAPSPLEQSESLEQLRALWYGYPVRVAVTQEAAGIGVDTEADLKRVIAVLQKNQRSKR